jgi:hypothetical protein
VVTACYRTENGRVVLIWTEVPQELSGHERDRNLDALEIIRKSGLSRLRMRVDTLNPRPMLNG